MRRIFTSAIAIICAISASAQCTVSTTGTVGITNQFNGGNSEGFAGDFTISGTLLRSSNISAGTTKLLSSPIFYFAPNTTDIQIRFDLGGNASVTSYTIYAQTNNDANISICSGGALSAGANFFTAARPSSLSSGENFILFISYTVAGGNGNNVTIDNFGINAQPAAGALPVNFTGINARLVNGSVNLNWTVDAEEHVLGYEVEKSNDGRSFSKVGFVAATKQMQYSFVDATFAGTAYYRVKSVDVDGKFKYTSVVSMKGGKSGVVVKAFPTITRGAITIQHDAAVKGSSISIASQEGRIVKSVLPSNGAIQTNVDLSSLQAGIYLVRYNDGLGNVETLKVVKQ